MGAVPRSSHLWLTRDWTLSLKCDRATNLSVHRTERWVTQKAANALGDAVWRDVEVTPRKGQSPIRYAVADLAAVCFSDDTPARLFAAQTGGIVGLHPGTIIGLTSLRSSLENLIRYIGWARWIRPLVRRQERTLVKPSRLSHRSEPSNDEHGLMLRYRSNIALGRLQDKSSDARSDPEPLELQPTWRAIRRSESAERRGAVRRGWGNGTGILNG